MLLHYKSKNNRLTKLINLFLITSVLFVFSCGSNMMRGSSTSEQNNSNDSASRTKEFSEFCEENGFTEYDEMFLFEGDVAYSKETVKSLFEKTLKLTADGPLKANIATNADDLYGGGYVDLSRQVWTAEEKINITYSFVTPQNDDYIRSSMATKSLNDEQVRNAFRDAVNAWMNVSDVVFQEVSSGGVISVRVVNESRNRSPAWAFFPHSKLEPNLNINYNYVDNPDTGEIMYDTYEKMLGLLTHEVGHTLGLKHEHQREECPVPGRWNQLIAGEPFGPYDSNSIMSYETAPHTSGISEGDKAVMMHLYGKNGEYILSKQETENFEDFQTYKSGSKVLAVWSRDGNVYARLTDMSDNSTSGYIPVALDTGYGNTHHYPKAVINNGKAVIVYIRRKNSESIVEGKVIDLTTEKVDTWITFNTENTVIEDAPVLAEANGNLIVLWNASMVGLKGRVYDISENTMGPVLYLDYNGKNPSVSTGVNGEKALIAWQNFNGYRNGVVVCTVDMISASTGYSGISRFYNAAPYTDCTGPKTIVNGNMGMIIWNNNSSQLQGRLIDLNNGILNSSYFTIANGDFQDYQLADEGFVMYNSGSDVSAAHVDMNDWDGNPSVNTYNSVYTGSTEKVTIDADNNKVLIVYEKDSNNVEGKLIDNNTGSISYVNVSISSGTEMGNPVVRYYNNKASIFVENKFDSLYDIRYNVLNNL